MELNGRISEKNADLFIFLCSIMLTKPVVLFILEYRKKNSAFKANYGWQGGYAMKHDFS